MIKLSRKQFYKNHSNEISKYLSHKNSTLHISSTLSEDLKLDFNIDTYKVDPQESLDFKSIDLGEKKYNLIIVSDIFEVSNDIYQFIKFFKRYLSNDGKVLLTSINPKWNFIFKIFEAFRLKKNSHINAFIHPSKISNVFSSLNFENINNYNRQIFPFRLLGFGYLLNQLLELLFSFFNLGIKTYFLYQQKSEVKKSFTKTIIVPAKNEEGNLEELVERIPIFREPYEIIIMCGPSKDNTLQKAHEIKIKQPEKNIKVFEQTKNGKANAVWEAIESSSNEVIAILDSDISVDPEELGNFFDIFENTNCDFVNGTRLMYPMEDSAMRYLNKLGNRAFQFIISKITGVNLSDTLCGTKVFKKSNLDNLYNWQKRMKISDPFCDFDLIFSSAYSGSKILEYPVHYRKRKYGTTNISRFRDGWILILYLFNSLILLKTSSR